MLPAAERYQRIFSQRRAIRAVRGGDAEKGLEQVPYRAFRQVAGDEDQPGSVVVIGPAVEPRGRVEDVLNAMHNDRRIRHFGQLHDALDAQELGAMRRAQQLKEHFQRAGGDRFVAGQDKRPDMLVVPIDVVHGDDGGRRHRPRLRAIS